MDNVIDASNRFTNSRMDESKATPLDRLRGSARTERTDAILFAKRLGAIAEKLSPKKPKDVARQWFNELWSGERWAKRKRYILLDGETAAEPMGSSGTDWAALIERAAASQHSGDSDISKKERERACRDVLRGSSYLPALPTSQTSSDSARSLLVALINKISHAIEEKTDIIKLWEIIEQTPIVLTRTTEYNIFKFDENTAKLENVYQPWQVDDSKYIYRLEQKSDDIATDVDWCYPRILVGFMGYRRNNRIFVIPHHFVDELPFDQEFEDGDKALVERVPEWLALKKVIPDKNFKSLPDKTYNHEAGFGWKSFTFDMPRRVWAELRPRSDGSPGLWLSSYAPLYPYIYPILPNWDALSIQASCGNQFWPSFEPMPVDMAPNAIEQYEFLYWPVQHSEFLVDSTIPEGAASGLIDSAYDYDIARVEGWVDDLENAEVQDFLFRLPETARFCPSITLDDYSPPPCRVGTVAAAIFSNTGSEPESRIAMQFIRQAEIIATAGLAFHATLLASNRARIESMIVE